MSAVVLVTAVGAGCIAVAATHGAQHRLAKPSAARRHTAAVLTEDAADASVFTGRSYARASWTSGDGARHTGVALVPPGAKRGTRITVWTDPAGALVPAPLSRSAVRAEGLAAGIGAAAGVCLVSLAAWNLAVQVADRRRAEQWEWEWARVDPRHGRRTA